MKGLAAAVLGLILAGCVSESSYSLHINLPDDPDPRQSLAELAFWALDPGGVSCDQLVAGERDPEEDMTVHARLLMEYPEAEALVLPRVPSGRILFHAEGRASTGVAILRGCVEVRIEAGKKKEINIDMVCVCQPVPGACAPAQEAMGNDVDDDCDGLTDECGSELDCDDVNGCTQDLCVAGECQHPQWPDTTDCSDGDVCTEDDACLSGVCTGTPKNCSAFAGQCVRGWCDEVTGQCSSEPMAEGDSCDDGLYCTVGEECSGGICSGTARDCADQDDCTRDQCSEGAQLCEHILDPGLGTPEGPVDDDTCSNLDDDDCDGSTDLDDTDCMPCTVDADCDDGNLCTQDACVSSQCEHDSAPFEGTGCDDGKYCTDPDTCVSGICGGPDRDCSHLGDACHQGYCDEASDDCQALESPNGTGCDDGEYCTLPDTCTAGVCGGPGRDCGDGDDCTADTCDENNNECDHLLQPDPGAEGWAAGAATCGNGVDDDCDLQTDMEDPDCCQPDCAGLECGPDPECGAECGPCQADETCWSGKCVKGEWVTIHSGGQSFQMGSPGGELGRDDDEIRHQVTFSGHFEIWSVEVTQEWFEEVMGYNPSYHSSCGDDCPVENVSWHEAAAFCNALSEAEERATCYDCSGTAPDFSCGLDSEYSSPYECNGYRLPTEAEWEYAARAGTQTSTYNGNIVASNLDCDSGDTVLEPIAWFCWNSGGRTHEVMTRDPNGWDLYDMLGNVWEWCHDWAGSYPGDETDPWGLSGGTKRIVRGCAYDTIVDKCRAANRGESGPVNRIERRGLRPARSQ